MATFLVKIETVLTIEAVDEVGAKIRAQQIGSDVFVDGEVQAIEHRVVSVESLDASGAHQD